MLISSGMNSLTIARDNGTVTIARNAVVVCSAPAYTCPLNGLTRYCKGSDVPGEMLTIANPTLASTGKLMPIPIAIARIGVATLIPQMARFSNPGFCQRDITCLRLTVSPNDNKSKNSVSFVRQMKNGDVKSDMAKITHRVGAK